MLNIYFNDDNLNFVQSIEKGKHLFTQINF